jgi:tRNA threonylcarbamoyl adenosine modification protein YeaZ
VAGATPLLILAFDTGGPHVAAALLRGGEVLDSVSEPMERGQAERLVDLLGELLAGQGLDFTDLDAVACGTGPGNFTGVRIAVAAARGLALARGIPAFGVTRFEAEAEGLPRPCLVALDARRGESYVQRFGDGAVGPVLLPEGAEWPLDGCISTTGDARGLPDAAGARAPLAPDKLAEAMGRVAGARTGTAQPRPAPLYLRGADAAPPREAPPVLLP